MCCLKRNFRGSLALIETTPTPGRDQLFSRFRFLILRIRNFRFTAGELDGMLELIRSARQKMVWHSGGCSDGENRCVIILWPKYRIGWL